MTEENPLEGVTLPRMTDEVEPFWEAAKDHELRMQKCGDCGYVRWVPSPVCPECWSKEYTWTELSGKGEVNSWVVFHKAYYEAFEDDLPYNVAEIELEEGPRYIANIVECDNDDIYTGMPVEVVFDDILEHLTLPRFKPI